MSAFTGKIALAAVGLAAVLAGCTTQGPGRGPESAPMAAADPRDCPRIEVPEARAVMRKGTAPAYEYIVSVSDVTRSCRIEGGQVYMDVGVAGRIVPGAAARAGQVTVPLRVSVRNAGGELYSKAGRVAANVVPGGPTQFTYVDRGIVVPEGGRLLVQAGLDQ